MILLNNMKKANLYLQDCLYLNMELICMFKMFLEILLSFNMNKELIYYKTLDISKLITKTTIMLNKVQLLGTIIKIWK